MNDPGTFLHSLGQVLAVMGLALAVLARGVWLVFTGR